MHDDQPHPNPSPRRPGRHHRPTVRTAAAASVLSLAVLAGGTTAFAEGSFSSFVRNVGTGFESRAWFDGNRSSRSTTIAFAGCRTVVLPPAPTTTTPTTGTSTGPTPPSGGSDTATLSGGANKEGTGGTTTTITTITTITRSTTKAAKKPAAAKKPKAAPAHATVQLVRSTKGWPDTNRGSKRVCAKSRSWGRVPAGQYRFRVSRINGRSGAHRLTASRVRVRY